MAGLRCRIGIVGGGFSGVMVAYHLVRNSRAAEVTIFEQFPLQLAAGRAYAPASKWHLLNVPAGSMGALAGEPDHFHRWLAGQGIAVPAEAFVSRQMYGKYLAHMLTEAKRVARGRLDLVTDKVREVRREGNVLMVLSELSKHSFSFDHIILATGTTPRVLTARGTVSDIQRRIIQFPWRDSAMTVAAPNDTIALVGSGLSAVDVMLEAYRENFGGKFVVLSRSGLFPCVHATADVGACCLIPDPEWDSIRQAVREIRAMADDARDWQSVVDALRPHLNAAWKRLSLQEQLRFRRHLVTLWDRHRHRMPQCAAEALHIFKSRGQLDCIPATVVELTAEPDRVVIALREKGQAETKQISVSRVVNCSGFDLNLTRNLDPLCKKLRDGGLAIPGCFGIGWHTDSQGAHLAACGARIAGMWSIGALRRGAEFESTAVRELRVQAQSLAEAVVA